MIRLEGELPDDPEERAKARAEMIRSALDIAVKEPKLRRDMLLGEAYRRYREVVTWLIAEIDKEEPAVQNECQIAAQTVHASWLSNVRAVQELLIADAMTARLTRILLNQECLTIEMEPQQETPGLD